MVGSLGVVCRGSVHHALGVAALTMGRLDVAVEQLRAAGHANLALGHRPAMVSSQIRLAEALTPRGRHGDAAEARRAGDSATRESSVLGIPVPHPVTGAAAGSEPATCVRDG